MDGEPGGVLGLTVHSADSADINTFIALLKVLNPAKEQQITHILKKPHFVEIVSIFVIYGTIPVILDGSDLAFWKFMNLFSVDCLSLISLPNFTKPTRVADDSPEHPVLDVVVRWQCASFLQPLNFGFYTTC